MGIHIQSGAIDPQTIKPISGVTALILSAGVNNATTPVLDVMNEISGPAHIFRVYANGVVKLDGVLPRLVLGTSSSNPEDGDNVSDGALMVQTGTHNLFCKSGSVYRKVNSEESVAFTTTVTVNSNSYVDLANFTVPSGKTLIVRSVGSLLYDADISVKVVNVTDSTDVTSTSSPTSIVNSEIPEGKTVKFQVINNSGSQKSASVVIKYEFI